MNNYSELMDAARKQYRAEQDNCQDTRQVPHRRCPLWFVASEASNLLAAAITQGDWETAASAQVVLEEVEMRLKRMRSK